MNWKDAIVLGLSLADLLGLLCVLGTVWGIKMMSSPVTAVRGNLLGAVSMTGAIIVTLVSEGIIGGGVLWFGMAVGTALGYWLSIKVAMIQMPQMVAILNGFGGGSSALVSLLTLAATLGQSGVTAMGEFEKITAVLGLIVGAVTFSGSVIAGAKLHGKMSGRPIVFDGQQTLNSAVLIASLAMGLAAIIKGGTAMMVFAVLSLLGSLAYGVLFTIKVGGADMPITVSLLNSFSGVAASISGFAISNPLLIAIGAVVGASGLILTQIMCRAMNRTLGQVLSGKTTVLRPVPSQTPIASPSPTACKAEIPPSPAVKHSEPAHIVAARSAGMVIIVPGYGMALAQAQADVKKLMDLFEENGAEVKVAIHPVAGRMPGHMNVLLAEVDVPYDKLYEMDQINPEFPGADLVVVVGANDVINPAANTAEGTPIYGMPILNVDQAKHIVICNYDTKPGYAGVDNPLYSGRENVTLLLGDAAVTVKELIKQISSPVVCDVPAAEGNGSGKPYVQVARGAERVIIVPGYGMALAQAQADVKKLMDLFEENGAEVKVAIHPVAGRMPGHMNVLLAEVDVPYDKLYEMDQINSEFPSTDLVVVVGANDVINPAANTAEGTPIYGMPILNVDQAKHIVICNYDTKPGYAGVDNPLYSGRDNVTLLLGDAAVTVKDFASDIRHSEECDAQASAAPTASDATSHGHISIAREARHVIFVPGYGMALAQAQADVKKLMDLFEENGAEVKVAIHPVAGRMPGHMNVLLAEVDVPYDKLYEMDQINSEFPGTDLVVVVGANDVINPAANTAEGTPIYGMPILNVYQAKHVIICNYDTKPGYAGVDNPLYAACDNVTLLLGDAAVTIKEFIRDLQS